MAVYFYECIIKILGSSFQEYFEDSWSVFDFTMLIF